MPVNLPPLPSDLTFTRLGPDPDDLGFSFDVKRAAMGPHVATRWGWDEAYQLDLHRTRYALKPFFGISRGGLRLGTVSFEPSADHVRLGEFYLLPEHQGQGTGSVVLAHCLDVADGLDLPVRLEHLVWNPVGSLYRRFGFVELGRSDIHLFLERPVPRRRCG